MENSGLLLTLALVTFGAVICWLLFSYFRTRKAAQKGETSDLGRHSEAEAAAGESSIQQHDKDDRADPVVRPRP